MRDALGAMRGILVEMIRVQERGGEADAGVYLQAPQETSTRTEGDLTPRHLSLREGRVLVRHPGRADESSVSSPRSHSRAGGSIPPRRKGGGRGWTHAAHVHEAELRDSTGTFGAHREDVWSRQALLGAEAKLQVIGGQLTGGRDLSERPPAIAGTPRRPNRP